MRYKINLLKSVKTNYIALPADSPLRHGLVTTQLCTAIRVQPLQHDQILYFGFTGQQSGDSTTIDISLELARLLNLEQDSLVNASIEYSFDYSESIQLEPLTVDDFELVETHSSYVEEQLLNQVGVFYNEQKFVLWLGNALVRLKAICAEGSAKCYYLGVDSELHIQTKIRQKPTNKSEQTQEKVEPSYEQLFNPIMQSINLPVRDSSLTPIGCINIFGDCDLFKDGDIVKVCFEGLPSIADIEFKEFQTFKLTQKPLPIEDKPKELFFAVQIKDQHDEQIKLLGALQLSVFQGLSNDICKVSKLECEFPKIKSRPITVSFRTSHPLLRQAAQSQNQQIFDVLKRILQKHIEQNFTQNQLVVCDEMILLVNDFQEHLDLNSLSERRISETVLPAHSIQFKFIFGNQLFNTISNLSSPKFFVITKTNLEEFISLIMLGYDSGQIIDQKQDIISASIKKNIMDQVYNFTIDEINASIQEKQNFVVFGPQNVGKTTLVQQLGYDVIDCVQIGTLTNSTEGVDFALEYLELRYKYFCEHQHKYKVFVLDSVHGICPFLDEQSQPVLTDVVKSHRITSWLLSLSQDVRIGLTTRHFSQINSRLLQLCAFDNVIEMLPPTSSQRYEFIKEEVAPIELHSKEVQLQKMAQFTEYFLVKDLFYLWSNRDQEFYSLVEKYKAVVFPSSQNRADNGAPDWNTEVGGLKDAKQSITEMFGITQRYGLFFQGQRVNQGLLLYGPPGCGKTYLASSIARQFNINFISVKGPELLNKYIGASEQNVRELFERAQQQKPSILFFDEFDSLVPKRGGSSSVTDRIVNQFLCYLDGVEGRSGVFVIAATSRPDLVDVALLRPGRIDKSVFCGFPDEVDRKEILKIYLKKYNFEGEPNQQFLNELALKTLNFTNADIKGLCQNAQLTKLQKNIASSETTSLSVENADLLEELNKFVKGMTREEMERYDAIYRKWQDKGSLANVGAQKQMLH